MKLTPLDPWISRKIAAGESQLTRQELEAWQLLKLNETLALARSKSPFYRNLFAAKPDSITSLIDLRQFPFTTPDDIRRNPLQFVCVSQGEIQRVVTLQSSGTTGEPKRIYFTADDQELTIDFFGVGMSTLVQPGERVLILLPGETSGSVGDLLATGLSSLGAIPVRYGPVRDPQDALAAMQTEKIDVLVGAPVNVLTLARFYQVRKKTNWIKPGQVLLSTDHVPQAIIAALERIWGCTVYNHYGMTEMGLGGGVECQARQGYHLREADLYFEIVDPITGEAVQDGEQGEVVFSTLTRRGMPLIRYRTGDLSRFIPWKCSCGTVLYNLEKVTQRLSGQVILGKPAEARRVSTRGNLVLHIADLDEVLFSIPQLVNFSASLITWEGKDRLEIKVITMPDAPSNIADQALLLLDSIPTIEAARQAGVLDVRIQLQEFEVASAGILAKRVIVDQRG